MIITRITQQEAVLANKALIDGYRESDWYKKAKPPVYNVVRKKNWFRQGCNDGYWAITKNTKKIKVLKWINIGSNEIEDWFRNLQAIWTDSKESIHITTKTKTDIKVFLGWKIAYKQYKPYLRSVIETECPTHIEWISHSKGCPVTAYAVENVKFYYPEIIQQSIYFSAPRPGNKSFIKAHDEACDSIMIFINGDAVCALPPWGRQIGNVKGYWKFPPFLPWAHYPTRILECVESDQNWP